MSKKDTFIIDAIRTPIGKFGGTLSPVRTDDLAAHVIRSLMDLHDFDPAEIDDVIMGCANQAGEDNRNVARMALLLAGLPFSVPGETVNRLCASGMSGVIHAHRTVQSGDGDLFIAGGVEHMTRGPWVISKASKSFGRDSKMKTLVSVGASPILKCRKSMVLREWDKQQKIWLNSMTLIGMIKMPLLIIPR